MSDDTLDLFLSVLALLCWAGTAAIIVGALVRRFQGRPGRLEPLRDDVGRVALTVAWIVAAVTMLGSLYYSKIRGYIPCELCWYQRIALYPWAVVLGIAAWRRDVAIRIYAIPVLVIGAVISTYHVYIQNWPPDGGTSFCTADAPCTTRYIDEFGIVSIPFMALSAAVFIITLLAVARPSVGAARDPGGAS